MAKIKFNPDGSIIVPKWEPDPIVKKPRKKKGFWDIWKDEDIWFVYFIPSKKLLKEIEKDFKNDYPGESFDNAYFDVMANMSDFFIVVGKTQKSAAENAWKSFNSFSEKERADYEVRVDSAISVLGQDGYELTSQFVFNPETKIADMQSGLKERMLRREIERAY